MSTLCDLAFAQLRLQVSAMLLVIKEKVRLRSTFPEKKRKIMKKK